MTKGFDLRLSFEMAFQTPKVRLADTMRLRLWRLLRALTLLRHKAWFGA